MALAFASARASIASVSGLVKGGSMIFTSTALREARHLPITWEAGAASTAGYDKPVMEWLPSAASPFAAPE